MPETAPTQPEPAEGARADEPRPAPGHGSGKSADAPAEGADDADTRLPGSPAG